MCVCVCGCDHEKSILLVLVSFISFVNLTHIFTLHQSIVNLYDYVFNHMYAIDIPYIINVTIIEYTFAVYCISKLIILQNTNHLHTVFRLYHTASCIICAACSMDWSLSFITCTCQDMSVMSCRFQTWQVCFSEPGTTPPGRMRWDEEVLALPSSPIRPCTTASWASGSKLPAPNHCGTWSARLCPDVCWGMLPEMRLKSSQLHRNS